MKTNKEKTWPTVRPRADGKGWQVDLGKIDRKRVRKNFPTEARADTYALHCRKERENLGTLANAITDDVRMDAVKANQILCPHNVTILESAKYYQKHVLAYKDAPIIKEVVAKYIYDSQHIRNLKPRALEDVRNRLNMFVNDFGEDKLFSLTRTEIEEWVFDDGWKPRTRISYRTKLYQLWNFALDKEWVDSNIIAKIPVPKLDDIEIHALTVEQAKALLEHSKEFGLSSYIAIGLFCGVRSAEMLRMTGKNVDFANNVVSVPASASKGGARRVIIMQPALIAWLESSKKELEKGKPLVENFRNNFDDLREAAGISEWYPNAIRHSFASYYLAKFRNVPDTAYQMGNSPEVIKKHYDAVVLPVEANKYWNLKP